MPKLSDLIEPFEDDFAYRLVDVQTISKNKEHSYIVTYTFQRLSTTHNNAFFERKHHKLKDYQLGKRVFRECSVAYIRVFVIGSIWHNKSNVPVLFKPSYLTRYKLNHFSFLNGSIEECSTLEKIDPESIPTLRFFKKEKKTINIPYDSRIIIYELEKPLFHHRNIDGIVPLKENEPEWKTNIKTTFLAFYSYEIFRYFFSSFSCSDLNERLIKPNISDNPNGKNDVYGINKSKESGGNNLLYLRYNEDKKDAGLIGNIAYDDKFRTQLISFGEAININGNPFTKIKGLPISQFDQLVFSAKPVKLKSSDKFGLLIFEIESCKNYRKTHFKPVIPLPESNSNSKMQVSRIGSKKAKGSGEKVDEEPIVAHDKTTSSSSNHDVEDTWGGLLDPNDDFKTSAPLYEHYSESKKGFIYDSDTNENEARPPGRYSHNPSSQKNRILVDPTDYFSLFPKIVNGIKESLNKNELKCKVTYLNFDDREFVENSFENLDEIGSLDEKAFLKYYFVQFYIVDSYIESYIYLLEKTDRVEVTNRGRTWLYSEPNLFCIPPKNDEIIKIKDSFLKDDDTKKPFHKFNHLSSKKIDDNKYDKIDDDKALENHIKKIESRIREEIKKRRS